MKKIIAFSFALSTFFSAQSATYYVSTTGNDANSGIQTSPWRTISKALASIAANQGHILMIGAGTFVETSILNIPSGVSVMGASSTATIIESSASIAMQVKGAGMTVANVQTISGFLLDGKNNANCEWGLNIENTNGISLKNVEIKNFDEMGLRLHDLANSEIQFIKISESAKGFPDNEVRVGTNVPSWAIIGCSGDLGLGNLDKVVIHDIEVNESQAYAVKVSTYKIWGNSSVYLKDVEMYNMNLQVSSESCSVWGKLCFELFDIDNFNVKIHHSRFTSVASIIPANHFNFPNKGIEFYNNHFDIHKSGNNYAVEYEHDNMVIHHNYFEGGLYPFALVPRSPIKGMSAHHNVFYDQNGPSAPVNFESGVESGTFANNTIVLTNAMWDDFKIFNMKPGYNSNLRVVNNVFVKNTNRASIFNNGTIGTVEYNLFQGLGTNGSNAFTGDPQLNLAANGLQRFVPVNAASVENRGVVIAGITDGYTGSAPDLGAFEIGQALWTYGPGLNTVPSETIFQIPGMVEAELTTLSGGPTKNTNHPGYTGTGFVDNFSPVGAKILFKVNNASPAAFSVGLHFANANLASSLTLYVNNVKQKIVTFPSSGSWGVWSTKFDTLSLLKGISIIEYRFEAENGGYINIDNILFDKVPAFFDIPSTIEAENAELLSGAGINTNHTGFSGTGFVDQYIAVGPRTLFRVNAAGAGNFDFKLFYACENTQSSLSIYVNGTKLKQTLLPTSGSWDAWTNKTETINLKKGINTVEYVFDAGDIGHVNLDKIIVTKSTITALEQENESIGITVFPNPFTSIINISQKQAWKLYNNLGQLINSGNSETVDGSLLDQGTYVLRMENGFVFNLIK